MVDSEEKYCKGVKNVACKQMAGFDREDNITYESVPGHIHLIARLLNNIHGYILHIRMTIAPSALY